MKYFTAALSFLTLLLTVPHNSLFVFAQEITSTTETSEDSSKVYVISYDASDIILADVGLGSKIMSLASSQNLDETIGAVIENTGADITRNFENLNTIAASMTEAEKNTLMEQIPGISIREPKMYQLTLSTKASYVQATQFAADMGYTGSGQYVAVIDSGIDDTTSMLTGKLNSGYEACFSNSGLLTPQYVNPSITTNGGGYYACPTNIGTLPTRTSTSPLTFSPATVMNASQPLNTYSSTIGNDINHGTNVAQIAVGSHITSPSNITGIAPGANLVGVNVSTFVDSRNPVAGIPTGTGTGYEVSIDTTPDYIAISDVDLIEGLRYVQYLKDTLGVPIAAVNMSLSDNEAYDDQNDCDTRVVPAQNIDNTLVKSQITALNNSGIVVVAASGNNGYNQAGTGLYAAGISFPSCLSNVIAVGNLDTTSNIEPTTANTSINSSSNVGDLLDIFAPGTGVLTASNNGFTGTSAASPFVAGAVALLKSSYPSATVSQITNALTLGSDVTVNLSNIGISKPMLRMIPAFDKLNQIVASAPTLTITSTVPSVISGPTAFTFTVTDDIGINTQYNSLPSVTLDGTSQFILTSPATQISCVQTSLKVLTCSTTIEPTVSNATTPLKFIATDRGGNILNFSQTMVVDTTAPTITNITSSTANGTYGVGTVIPVAITFTNSVTVTGIPQILLETGTTDISAVYTSGSGTNTLIFNYTITSNDAAADLDYASTAALSINSGTIKNTSLLDAVLTLPAPGAAGSLGANKNIVINSTVPTVTSITAINADNTYTSNELIRVTVTFTSPVIVTGSPTLTLETGTTDSIAAYSSGSGTSTLTFAHIVVSTDSTLDLDYTSTSALLLNSGTILSLLNNLPATLTLPVPGALGSLSANKAIILTTAVVVPVVSSGGGGGGGGGGGATITPRFSLATPAITPTPIKNCVSPSVTVTSKSSKANIIALEKFLQKYYFKSFIPDQKYGIETITALKSIQKKLKIKQTGVFDTVTKKAILKANCK